MLVSDFQILRPQFETAQEKTLEWLASAHARAARDETFREKIREKLWHVGCKPDRIEKRGHVLADFLGNDWEKMEIYQLDEHPKGKDFSHRSKIFDENVSRLFEIFYQNQTAPDDLIHVSCTGYVSPSGAQKIVSAKGWGETTTVTHAYHMGCYGSLPALRMAKGFLASEPEKRQTDIVHTEICCLHVNPSLHSTDQLVTQSLFADGFIKYSLKQESSGSGFALLAIQEEIIPESTHAMTWNVVDWGNQMYLAKEVPVLIARHLEGYLKRLCAKGKRALEKACFAIHPGGPKILQHVQQLFRLSDKQMEHSFNILKKYGNMSSATLPHIWDALLKDETIPDGTPVVSLAFGPGLTISGSLMEKRCGA